MGYGPDLHFYADFYPSRIATRKIKRPLFKLYSVESLGVLPFASSIYFWLQCCY